MVFHRKRKILEAKEVWLCPPKENVEITLDERYLKEILINKIVSVGDKISFNEKEKNKLFNSGFNKIFKDFGMDYLDEFKTDMDKIKVFKTYPKGKVKITKDTKINQLNEFPNEDGVPKSKIINIRKLPNLKDFFEVTNIDEIIKISNAGFFINKFEDKDKVIYIVDKYYFIKKK